MLNFLRISARERDHQQKRQAFDASLSEFRQAVREKTRPKNILKEHPQLLVAGLVGGISLIRAVVGKKFTPLPRGFDLFLWLGKALYRYWK